MDHERHPNGEQKMSDFSNGIAAGMAARNAAVREYSGAISEWKTHSANLQKRLSQAEHARIEAIVERTVSVEYVTALRRALKELVPNHPLLQEDVAVPLFETTRARAWAEQGYAYDPATRTLSPR